MHPRRSIVMQHEHKAARAHSNYETCRRLYSRRGRVHVISHVSPRSMCSDPCNAPCPRSAPRVGMGWSSDPPRPQAPPPHSRHSARRRHTCSSLHRWSRPRSATTEPDATHTHTHAGCACRSRSRCARWCASQAAAVHSASSKRVSRPQRTSVGLTCMHAHPGPPLARCRSPSRAACLHGRARRPRHHSSPGRVGVAAGPTGSLREQLRQAREGALLRTRARLRLRLHPALPVLCGAGCGGLPRRGTLTRSRLLSPGLFRRASSWPCRARAALEALRKCHKCRRASSSLHVLINA